jgi:hypothetical protein
MLNSLPPPPQKIMPAHKAGEIIFCVEAVQHHPHLKEIATIKRCFW